MLTIDLQYIVAHLEREIAEEISLPTSGLAVNFGNIRDSNIELHIRGKVAAIRDIWENGSNYNIKVWFNNARHQQQTIPNSANANVYYNYVQVDVLGIDIIDTRVIVR